MSIFSSIISIFRSSNYLGRKFYFNLLTKFLLTFLIIILVPFVIFTNIANYNTSQINKKNVSFDAINSLSYFCHLMDNKLYTMDYLADQIIANTGIENFIYHRKFNDESFSLPPTIGILNQILKIEDGSIANLCNVYIFNRHNCYNIYVKDYYQDIDSKVFPDDLYKAISYQPNTSLFWGTNLRKYSNGDERLVLSSAKFFKNAGYFYSDVVLVDYDYYSLIKDIYSKTKQLEYLDKNFYILDSNKNIMYNDNSKLLMTKLDYSFIDTLAHKTSGSLSISMSNKKYYLTYYTSPFNQWKYVSFIPMSKINSSMLMNNIFNSVLALFLFILLSVFAYVSSSMLLKPLNKLVKSMSEIKKGNFSVRISIKHNDETKFLAESFNEMASNLEEMINKVYLTEIRQKDAELLSLQSQINPHFLYNTLDSIRGAAVSANALNIVAMSKSLASMLRYSINDRMIVSIKDEITHLQNYLDIQNFRFDNRFKIEFILPSELKGCNILRLTLQPLVENSIMHGFNHTLRDGIIVINFLKVNENTKIRISDNGIGLTNESVLELNNVLNNSSHSNNKNFLIEKADNGKGLKNVNMRIKLYFGFEYGIQFIESDIGTVIEITIPYINEVKKDETSYS